MAEILPSFVQRTIPGSSYVTIVCSSEKSEGNFCRSNEDATKNEIMFEYSPKSTISKKVPTENEDSDVISGMKGEKEPKIEGEVKKITESSQGLAAPEPAEQSDEDENSSDEDHENLSRNNGPITVYSHAVDKPASQLVTSDVSDLVEEFQGLVVQEAEITVDVQQTTEITDKKLLNERGPIYGLPTHGSMQAEEFCVKYRKPCMPDVSSYAQQQYQYVDPPSTWNFVLPQSQYYAGHQVLPSVPSRPLPPTQVTYPFYHDPPLHPNVVVDGPTVLVKSTPGHLVPGHFPDLGRVGGSQINGYSASEELDLVSEYVKDQMQKEENEKLMKQEASPRNFTTAPPGQFVYNIDAATATTAAVSSDASVVRYANDGTGHTGSSPRNLWTPPDFGTIHIPSTVDMVDIRRTSPGNAMISTSCLNTGAASRSSGSPGSMLSPYPAVTLARMDASPGNEAGNRQQIWTDGGQRCGSLSPCGSQTSDRCELEIAYEGDKTRSSGPNSVASVDSIHSSPMNPVETESSGDESFEERQSKMAEAERKAESYEKESLISPDSNGDMALHLAMIDDDWYLAEAIINRLARLNLVKQVINVPNKLQQTPLCLAVIFNKSGIVEKLVENGADVNVHIKTCHDKLGPKFCQPLHLAASRGQGWKKTLRQLMKAENIDLDAFNSDGKSALHCAIESHGKKHNDQLLDCKEILRLLAENGANLNQPDCGHEKTPLHYAIERRDVGLVSRLLCLATSFQSRCEQSGISQMLEAKTGNGNTALHLAASVEMNTQEHKKMIQQLMCKGADPSVKNSDGFLPRELTKNREIVELLKGRMVTSRSPYSDRKRTA